MPYSYVPTWGNLMRNFTAMVQGTGLLIKVSVCAGPAFLQSGLRWSPDEFLWFFKVIKLCPSLWHEECFIKYFISSIYWDLLSWKRAQRYCCVYPLTRTRTLLQGCTVVSWLPLPCLCISSLLWFQPALWNSGKVREAEVHFLWRRNGRHKDPCPEAPQCPAQLQ